MVMEHNAVFGIHLGMTHSAIARIGENGIPVIIENFADGYSWIESAIYFPEDGDPVVGMEAKRQAEIEPNRVVRYFMRDLGKPDSQIYEFNGVKYDPIMLTALLIKQIKNYAEEQGHEVIDVVLTCPVYYGTTERIALKQAVELSGLNLLGAIDEPVATALSYFNRKRGNGKRILVYDLGGSSFDLALLDCICGDGEKDTFKIIGIAGDDRLGGVDWDNRLYEHLLELYADEHGFTIGDMDCINLELRQILRHRAEESKKKLSHMQSCSISVAYSGDCTRLTITRNIFNDLTTDLVEHTVQHIRRLLCDTDTALHNIDCILLAGGATKMPMISNALSLIFGRDKIRIEQPEFAVVMGATIRASNIMRGLMNNFMSPLNICKSCGQIIK